MTKTEIKTIYGFDHYVKGGEPFLSWWRAGLYLKFNEGRQSHVLIESYANDVNLDEFRKGDTLRVRLERVRSVPVVPWYTKLWKWFRRGK